MRLSIISVLVTVVLLGAGCGSTTTSNWSSPTSTNSTNTNTSMTTTQPAGLQITDTVVGTGTEAKAGQTISVHYTGTLDNGTKFDSSVDRGEPFTFTLGAGQVIQGWDEGFAGMKVGGKRTLVIPPALGYGNQAVGTIPANSTLHFDVELLDVK